MQHKCTNCVHISRVVHHNARVISLFKLAISQKGYSFGINLYTEYFPVKVLTFSCNKLLSELQTSFMTNGTLQLNFPNRLGKSPVIVVEYKISWPRSVRSFIFLFAPRNWHFLNRSHYINFVTLAWFWRLYKLNYVFIQLDKTFIAWFPGGPFC